MQQPLNNYLLISGSGRNSGKTTLACHIISQLSKNQPVIGLKISPHFHFNTVDQNLIIKSDNFNIYQEKSKKTGKDSSRMLVAGASKVYFIEAEDEGLKMAYDAIRSLIGNDKAVVCESGSLAFFFKPGFHIMVVGDNPDKSKASYGKNQIISDMIIEKTYFTVRESFLAVNYTNNNWGIKKLR